MLERYAPLWLAGLLGAGIMAAVMASDSQILALSTMFTEDVFAFYGGTARFGEARAGADRAAVRRAADGDGVRRSRCGCRRAIFDLAVQFAFSGYASLSPLLLRRAVLDAQHEVGRARGRAVDGVRGDLHRATCPARWPGSA